MREIGEELSSLICTISLAINIKQVITKNTDRQYCICELIPPCVEHNHSTIYSIVYQTSDLSSFVVCARNRPQCRLSF